MVRATMSKPSMFVEVCSSCPVHSSANWIELAMEFHMDSTIEVAKNKFKH